MTLRSAVDADGRFLAHTMDVVFDGGAYAATKIGPGVLPGGVFQGMAPYRVPHVRMEARAVYTNSVPGGIMRSPGELQGVWAAESHVDMIARELGPGPDRVPAAQRHPRRRHRRHRREDARAAGRGGAASACNRRSRDDAGAGSRTRHRSGHAPRRRRPLADARHAAARRARAGRDSACRTRARARTPSPSGWWLLRSASPPERVSVKYASTLGGVFDSGAGGSKSTHAIGAVAMQTGSELKQRLQELAAEVMGWPVGRDRAGRRPLRGRQRERVVRRGRGPHRARWAGAGRGHACSRAGARRGRRRRELHRVCHRSRGRPGHGRSQDRGRAAGRRRRHDHQSRWRTRASSGAASASGSARR